MSTFRKFSNSDCPIDAFDNLTPGMFINKCLRAILQESEAKLEMNF